MIKVTPTIDGTDSQYGLRTGQVHQDLPALKTDTKGSNEQ
jgi:hypothetical protein